MVQTRVTRRFRYRVYPNKTQEAMFRKTFGCVRKMHNVLLNECTNEDGTYNTKVPNSSTVRNRKGFEYMKEVDSDTLAFSRLFLSNSINKYACRKNAKNPSRIGRPRYKSLRDSNQSFTMYNRCDSNGSSTRRLEYKNSDGKWTVAETGNTDATHIYLGRDIGRLKLIMHRPLPEGAKYGSVTIIRESSGKYYVSLCVEFDTVIPEIKNLNPYRSVGLDYSSPFFFIDNQGNKGNYPKFYREDAKKLAHLQRAFSRTKKGSKNREKARIALAKEYERIRNKRDYWQWQMVHYIVDNVLVDYVFVETLNMQAICHRTKGKGGFKLGKTTYDNGWGDFTRKLEDYATSVGKHVIHIGKWEASSKTCSKCGSIKHDLTLKDRTYICPNCDSVMDRDVNAAINIRLIGMHDLGCNAGYFLQNKTVETTGLVCNNYAQ